MNSLAAPGGIEADQKLIGLEVLRFLSAIAVLVWHYQHFWFQGDQLEPGFVRTSQPLYPFLKLFYEWGVYGVQVFWFISGTIFFWKYLLPISAGRISGWRFFVLRASRLYPLHLLTFTLVAVLQAGGQASTGRFQVYQNNDLGHAVLQVFMASNWGLQRGDSYNGPIWSVSLEVLAYLAFFLFARRIATRCEGPDADRRIAAFTGITVIVSALAYQARLGQVFQCVYCFFVGGLAALAARSSFSQRHQATIAAASLAWIFGAAIVFRWFDWFERKPVVHLYITTAAPLLIHLLATQLRMPTPVARWAVAAGNTTYASYLLHFPLQLGLMGWATHTGWQLPREEPAFLLAYLGISVTLGAWVYRWFEIPVQLCIRSMSTGSEAPLRDSPADPFPRRIRS